MKIIALKTLSLILGAIAVGCLSYLLVSIWIDFILTHPRFVYGLICAAVCLPIAWMFAAQPFHRFRVRRQHKAKWGLR